MVYTRFTKPTENRVVQDVVEKQSTARPTVKCCRMWWRRKIEGVSKAWSIVLVRAGEGHSSALRERDPPDLGTSDFFFFAIGFANGCVL